jgi:hypothetical protein
VPTKVASQSIAAVKAVSPAMERQAWSVTGAAGDGERMRYRAKSAAESASSAPPPRPMPWSIVPMEKDAVAGRQDVWRRDPQPGMEAHMSGTAAPIQIPEAMRAEHAELHAALVEATRAPDPVGEAAREVARVLHPHFVREEQIALRPSRHPPATRVGNDGAGLRPAVSWDVARMVTGGTRPDRLT